MDSSKCQTPVSPAEPGDFSFLVKTENGCLVYQAPFGWQEFVKKEQ
jgi:hypothetical protein